MNLNKICFDDRLLDIFRRNTFFPFTIIISPFCPLLFKETELVSLIYLVFIIIDVFWSEHFKIAAKYIAGFKRNYYSLLLFSIAVQVFWILTKTSIVGELMIIVALILFFLWWYKFWTAWYKLVGLIKNHFKENSSSNISSNDHII